jgi:hypothetical protein
MAHSTAGGPATHHPVRVNHLDRVMPLRAPGCCMNHNIDRRNAVTLGPLEYTVIGFTGNEFDGSIAREIGRVVENGTIRIVDAVAIIKDGGGDVAIVEIDAKQDPRFASIAPLLEGRMGLFTPEDLAVIAQSLPAETAALVILFEHRWAVHVKEAVQAAGGTLLARAVIPPEVLEEAADELEAYTSKIEAGVA